MKGRGRGGGQDPPRPHQFAAALAGTSACSNGKFYCPNFGAMPVVLNSSMVDDGICGKAACRQARWPPCCRVLGPRCSVPASRAELVLGTAMRPEHPALTCPADCCDGSDERPGLCPNRCAESGAQLLKGQRQQVAATETAEAARDRHLQEIHGSEQKLEERKVEVEPEIVRQRPLTETMEGGAVGAGGWVV